MTNSVPGSAPGLLSHISLPDQTGPLTVKLDSVAIQMEVTVVIASRRLQAVNVSHI